MNPVTGPPGTAAPAAMIGAMGRALPTAGPHACAARPMISGSGRGAALSAAGRPGALITGVEHVRGPGLSRPRCPVLPEHPVIAGSGRGAVLSAAHRPRTLIMAGRGTGSTPVITVSGARAALSTACRPEALITGPRTRSEAARTRPAARLPLVIGRPGRGAAVGTAPRPRMVIMTLPRPRRAPSAGGPA